MTTVLRADAQRNLVRVLDAAREVFAEQGIDAPVTEIADRAGVGVGTIFRRFPTKDDLLVAVVEQRTQQLIEAADLALESPDPGAALRGFMETATAMQISDVCWCEAGADLFEREGIRELTDVLVGKIGEPLDVRADRRPDSVRRAGTRYSRASDGSGQVRSDARGRGAGAWKRYLAIILDGLRPEAARPLPRRPLSRRQFEVARRSQPS